MTPFLQFSDLKFRPDTFEFLQPDLITMDTKVSRIGIIDYADGMALFYEAKERENPISRLRLLSKRFPIFLRFIQC
jgi:hypothetical protein